MLRSALRILRSIGRMASRLCPIEERIFLFFPYFHLGGAEVVHLDIARVAATIGPVSIFFTLKSGSRALKRAFSEFGRIYDVSRICGSSITRQLFVGFMAGLLEQMKNPRTFGGNSRIFYYIVDEVQDRAQSADILHAFGGGVEDYSLPRTPYINTRVVLSQTIAARMEREYQMRGFGPLASRINIIGNAVEVPRSYTEKSDTVTSLIYVGRYSPEKRIPLLIRIANKILSEDPELRFTFIGFERPNDCQVDSYGGRLSFLGEVRDRDRLRSLYSQAHLLLLVSEREGFPLVIQEGMAHGVIPLSTDVGGIRDHVCHLSNGVLLTPRTEDGLLEDAVHWIHTLKADPRLYRRMSKAAHGYALEHFTRKQFDARYVELFTQR